MAEQYTFANRMFQTNQGPSFPAHQFIISGTSAPSTGSNLFAAENPNTNGPPNAGCDAPVGSTVRLIDPAGSETSNAPVYPCFDHQTLTDLLEAKSLTWRYYTPGIAPPPPPLYGSPAIWNGPEAIQHICGPQGGVCQGSDWTNNVVLDQKQILTDITNNQLRDVSWVIPSGQASDHAGMTDGTGPSWVASVVNAIGNSSYWADTAIFITWDDWGGWYDHVPPTILAGVQGDYQYGFRVPLIVVSAYTKRGYVDNGRHDFGSILRFIEHNFASLGLSEGELGFADSRATTDLTSFFHLKHGPRTFTTVAAPLSADFFINDPRPPEPPDND
jgi:phospholipase C